ncbi:MAG: aminotransferase class I/II-fold pyridoxal phosphate-dependent enzyme [Myxococcota bacterium]|nr:aminotransferase class I/II-fold pyridoxal phosphate-dependent enzyme [Myxococcota bacterium]
MGRATELNQLLKKDYPAASRLLTDFGKRLYFPKGVPAQAAEAKDCTYNATIGQLTDDNGRALPMPVMAEKIRGLTAEEVFLYTPQGGRSDLRRLWKSKLQKSITGTLSLPVVCCGLTHGLSICADLFVDEQTTVLLPSPRWGNYDMVFGIRRCGRIVDYQLMGGTAPARGWTWNLEGLAASLSQVKGKAFLALNIPSNPGGYTPSEAEVDQLVRLLKRHPYPLCIMLDEAYYGMEWEERCYKKSLFEKLSTLDKEKFLVVKVDGATKELFFFGGRIAFVSFNAKGQAAAALEEKVIACIRSTVSALPSPSQALVYSALSSERFDAEVHSIRAMLRERYQVLKDSLANSALDYWPFNSAFFALVATDGCPEAMRKKLLSVDVGVVSFKEANAVRLSYSTLSKDSIPEVVRRIESLR